MHISIRVQVQQGKDMNQEERFARLETAQEYERDWRSEIIARLDRLESKVDSNQRWTIGLLVLILIAVVGSN